MSVTIKQIAEIVGVSRGTVDRALHNRPGVKKEVAERIFSVANELGYKPNIIAKALSSKKEQKYIGIILNALDNPFYIDVIKGIKDKAKEIYDFGFEIILKTTKGYDINNQLMIIDEVVKSNIDGLIISPINDEKIANRLNKLNDENIALITVNTDIENVKKLAYIGSNYYQAGQTAGGIFGLISSGIKKNIGIITGSNLVLGHNLRIAGFKECINLNYSNISIVAIEENDDSDEKSYNVTKKILTTHNLDGIFFCAGGIQGGIDAIIELGLINKLNIITVDLVDVVKENLLNGNIIATICQEPYKQGFEAIKLMFDYLMIDNVPKNNIIFTATEIKLKYNL